MSDTPDSVSNSESSDSQPSSGEGRVPLVALGASAGGLEALETFFDTLPPDPGMAFVVLMHLSPEYESNLTEIIGHHTTLSVQKAEEGTTPEANAVYVLPPKNILGIDEGRLRVLDTTHSESQPTVIDTFFRALAHDQGANACGIVLSGTGSDGTQGIRALKEAGGFAMVQEPEEAAYDGMPRSAIQTNLVDIVAPVDRLAARLATFWTHPVSESLTDQPEELPEEREQLVRKILTHLYAETGHDFTNYKRSTVLRRLGRRLAVNEVTNLSDYLEFLRRESDEVEALFRELLICVTGFFRDDEAFEAIAQNVLPPLYEKKDFDDQVRVWSAGCATGEEAYSLAMLLHEAAERHDRPPNVQIFGTDLSEEAIETARQGLYPESVVADLSAERRERYLVPEGTHYRVRQELREMVLFAEHNLLEDPPFSKLDLVSCRNLLIYLNREMQEHVFEVLHYALRPEGVLFLGASESMRAAGGLFGDLDEKHGLFRRQPSSRDERGMPHIPLRKRLSPTPDLDRKESSESQSPQSVDELHRQLLVDEVASIVVNEDYKIVHLTDPAARYLKYQGGAPTHNLLDVTPAPLRMELRGALYQVFQKKTGTERQQIRMEVEGETKWVHVRVRPVGDGKRFAQVLLVATEAPDADVEVPAEEGEPSEQVAQLEEELRRAKEQLHTTTEEYETTTEELEASNEELLSMNEELQSKNEEIETSKEELQSVNEELKTTNQELTNKIEDLRRANSDLQNFLEATDIATLFLDRELRIQRFTPGVRKLFNIRQTDVGRALADFSQTFEFDQLMDEVRTVLDQLEPVEREIQTEEGRWFSVRLRPYRTVDDEIDGVVITFVDVTERVEAVQRLKEERNFVDSVLDTVGALVLVTDVEGDIVRFNEECEAVTGYSAEEVEGEYFVDLFVPHEERDYTEEVFAQLKEEGGTVSNENHWQTKDGDQRLIRWSTTVITNKDGSIEYVVGTGIDVTRRRRLEREVLAASDAERRRIGEDLHDMLASHLAGTAMMADGIAGKLNEPAPDAAEEIRKVVDLIREAGDQARALSHSLMPLAVQNDELADGLRKLADRREQMAAVTCSFQVEGTVPSLRGDVASHLYRIASEAVSNALKHADPDVIEIRLGVEDGDLVVTVWDDGTGIPTEIEPTDGLGLHMMKYRAELIEATLEVSPSDGGGTEVQCRLPLEKIPS